jgi:hypothetical protein
MRSASATLDPASTHKGSAPIEGRREESEGFTGGQRCPLVGPRAAALLQHLNAREHLHRQARRPSSSTSSARERVNAHHERRGAAEQVSNLDRLGDLGF